MKHFHYTASIAAIILTTLIATSVADPPMLFEHDTAWEGNDWGRAMAASNDAPKEPSAMQEPDLQEAKEFECWYELGTLPLSQSAISDELRDAMKPSIQIAQRVRCTGVCETDTGNVTIEWYCEANMDCLLNCVTLTGHCVPR